MTVLETDYPVDEADIANDLMELNISQAIRRSQVASPDARAEGYCLFCFEDLPTGRWCDDACRDDWAKRRDASRHPRNIKPAEDPPAA